MFQNKRRRRCRLREGRAAAVRTTTPPPAPELKAAAAAAAGRAMTKAATETHSTGETAEHMSCWFRIAVEHGSSVSIPTGFADFPGFPDCAKRLLHMVVDATGFAVV